MNEIRKIRVLIADDFELLRDVIRMYLERASDMEVIDEAPDLNDALDRANALQPDVIIMNDYLPPRDSAYAAALFRERGIKAAILTVSMEAHKEVIHRSLQNGVDGFMHKDEIDEFLIDGIRTIHHGKRFLSPKAQEVYNSTSE